MPPKDERDRNTSYVVELQYQYPVSDHIQIMPGAYVVFNPNHDSHNDTAWVGVVRTTFKF